MIGLVNSDVFQNTKFKEVTVTDPVGYYRKSFI